MSKIVVILGPTSVGKTSLAIDLCKKFNGEIISADSRQVFKYMDIGTGKAPLQSGFKVDRFDGYWKIDDIPIYMYDVVLPSKDFSVYDYAIKASNEFESVRRRGKNVFVVGGTGFYIDVLLGRQPISNVPPNPAFRKSLEEKSLDELGSLLREGDPKRYEAVDTNNRVRVIRALELLGEGASGSKTVLGGNLPDPIFLGLASQRSTLYSNVDVWVEKICEKGIIMETKALLDLGFRNVIPMKGIIYSSVVDFLDQKVGIDDMKRKIKFDLHGYIRRQLTWFGRNSSIRWFNVADKGFDTELTQTVKLYLNGS